MGTIRSLYITGNKISDEVQKALKVILAIMVFACALDLLLQVLHRFVLIHFVSFSLTWTNELAQDLIVWITYLAIGICYKENTMASVNIVYDKLKPRGKFILYLFTRIIIFIFLYCGIKYGIKSVQSVSNWRSPSLHIAGWVLYGAPLLGCVLITYEAIIDLLGVLCGELVPFVGRQPEAVEEELSENEKRILEKMEHEIDVGLVRGKDS